MRLALGKTSRSGGAMWMSTRYLVVVLAVLLMSACSTKFVYNNLDRLVRWQLNDFVDLTPTQREYLSREIDATLYWHRRNHLPVYADYLDQVSVRFSDSVTPEMIEEVFDQLFAWGEQVQERVMPVMVHMLQSLSDEQVARLPERMEDSNLDLAEDEMDGTITDHQDEWADDMTDALSRFIGRLSTEQKGHVALRSKGYRPELVLWADYRRRWQADLMALLKERKAPGFEGRFRQLLANRERYYGEEFTAVSESNEQLSREVAAYVLTSMSDRQRRRFTETLEDFSSDFRKLAADV